MGLHMEAGLYMRPGYKPHIVRDGRVLDDVLDAAGVLTISKDGRAVKIIGSGKGDKNIPVSSMAVPYGQEDQWKKADNSGKRKSRFRRRRLLSDLYDRSRVRTLSASGSPAKIMLQKKQKLEMKIDQKVDATEVKEKFVYSDTALYAANPPPLSLALPSLPARTPSFWSSARRASRAWC